MKNQEKRILAIDLRGRSFGFAVFEGPSRLLDWGVKSFRRGVNAVKSPASDKFGTLMDDFSPDEVVLRKRDGDGHKRRCEMREAILREAAKRRIPARQLSRSAVKNTFMGVNRNKYTIAAALAKRLPELAPRLPAVPRIWMSEDYRMSVFDAAALGIAYFGKGQSVPPSSPEL
jgi:hypothetical protein